mgnify:CR=1 FL=1
MDRDWMFKILWVVGKIAWGKVSDGCGVNKADGGALWLRGMTQAE